MRPRKKIESVSDIVEDPAIRVVFPPDHHQDFIDFSNIADTYKLNLTVFARHVWMAWKRKFLSVADPQFKNKMISEVVQSMHGIEQLDVFKKNEEWENIEVPKQNRGIIKPSRTIKIALDKVKKRYPKAFVKKAKKK